MIKMPGEGQDVDYIQEPNQPQQPESHFAAARRKLAGFLDRVIPGAGARKHADRADRHVEGVRNAPDPHMQKRLDDHVAGVRNAANPHVQHQLDRHVEGVQNATDPRAQYQLDRHVGAVQEDAASTPDVDEAETV